MPTHKAPKKRMVVSAGSRGRLKVVGGICVIVHAARGLTASTCGGAATGEEIIGTCQEHRPYGVHLRSGHIIGDAELLSGGSVDAK